MTDAPFGARITGVEHKVDAIKRAVESLGNHRDNNHNVNHFSIDAGGIGVWIAVTCCAVMLAANVFLAVIVMDHSRKIADLGDYLAAIYAQAPHLKPAEGEE